MGPSQKQRNSKQNKSNINTIGVGRDVNPTIRKEVINMKRDEYLDLLLEYEEEFQAKNKIPRNYIYTVVDDDDGDDSGLIGKGAYLCEQCYKVLLKDDKAQVTKNGHLCSDCMNTPPPPTVKDRPRLSAKCDQPDDMPCIVCEHEIWGKCTRNL